MADQQTEEKLWVRFERRAVYDKLASEGGRIPATNQDGSYVVNGKGRAHFVSVKGAGYAIYRDRDYITIRVPGETDFTERPVWDEEANPRSDTQRFAAQWRAYKAGQDQDEASGIPLHQLTVTAPPILQPSYVLELKQHGVRTVEQLVAMSDATTVRFLGLVEIKKKAQRYLDSLKAGAPVQLLRSELEKRDSELAELRREMEELRQASARPAVTEHTEEKPKPRSRRPNVE